jgi:hypothetical protein
VAASCLQCRYLLRRKGRGKQPRLFLVSAEKSVMKCIRSLKFAQSSAARAEVFTSRISSRQKLSQLWIADLPQHRGNGVGKSRPNRRTSPPGR